MSTDTTHEHDGVTVIDTEVPFETNTLGDKWCAICGERLLTQDPQVYVSVEGGIAEAGVSRGKVEILMWDWDEIEETDEPDRIRHFIEEASRLPEDDPERAMILQTMQDALDQLVDIKADDDRRSAEYEEQERRKRAAAMLTDEQVADLLANEALEMNGM